MVNNTHDNSGNYDFTISFDNARNAQIGGQQGDFEAEDSETIGWAAGVLDL